MIPEEEALRNAIERLYDAFRGYPLADVVDACPCCHTDEDQDRIHAKPLRELSVEDLDKFAADALCTWGGEDDLKHFLPRLLEILAFDPRGFTLPEALVGKLTYEGWKGHPYSTWRGWPPAERQALEGYFTFLWPYVLATPVDYPDTELWLEILAHAFDDLSNFLLAWREMGDSEWAIMHLARFIDHNRDELQRGVLDSVYWKQYPRQMAQVVQWVMDSETVKMLRRGLPKVLHDPWLVEREISEESLSWYLDA